MTPSLPSTTWSEGLTGMSSLCKKRPDRPSPPNQNSFATTEGRATDVDTIRADRPHCTYDTLSQGTQRDNNFAQAVGTAHQNLNNRHPMAQNHTGTTQRRHDPRTQLPSDTEDFHENGGNRNTMETGRRPPTTGTTNTSTERHHNLHWRPKHDMGRLRRRHQL